MNGAQTVSAASSAPNGNRTLRGPADRRLHDALALAGSLVAIALIGLLDHVGGTELRIYPLHVLPIAVTAWRVGPWAGALTAVIAVGTWVESNRLAGLSLPAVVWAMNTTAHLSAFAAVIVLVTHLRRSHAAERRLARLDPLTGLPNTRAFHEAAWAEIERQKRSLRPMSIAFFDLDNFKQVNDRFGHKTGDLLLSTVAQALRQATRATDHLGRLGGDEFAVLMPETKEKDVRQVLERLRSGVARVMSERGWPVSCSIGAVIFHEPPASVDDLIGRADNLMFSVKQAGKNALRIECIPEGGTAALGQEQILQA